MANRSGRGEAPRPQKIPQLHGSFNTRLPLEGAAERLKELPSALPGFFLLQEFFPYGQYRKGGATWPIAAPATLQQPQRLPLTTQQKYCCASHIFS